MEFICSRTTLDNAVGTASRAITSKTMTPALQGILLKADGEDGSLTLCCTDTSMSIITKIEAEVVESGAAIFPGRLFSELVKRLDDEEIRVTLSGNTALLETANNSTHLQVLDADEFPTVSFIDDGETLRLPKDKLRELIRNSSFAAAEREQRAVMNGIYFETEGDVLNVVALDGYRLAWLRYSSEDIKNWKAIIPTRTLIEISRLLGDDDGDVDIEAKDNLIEMRTGDTVLISAIIDGEYMPYRSAVPKNFTTVITLKKDELQRSVERANLMAAVSKDTPIIFDITQNNINITAISSAGNIEDRVDISNDGENLRIGFNPQYLIDALRVIDDDIIELKLNTPVSPCVIMKPGSDEYLYMVLPVRIK